MTELNQHLIDMNAFPMLNKIDVLILDERADAEFIAKCLMPRLVELEQKGLHEIAKMQQKRVVGQKRTMSQSAVCTEVKYIGDQVASTVAVAAAANDDDAADEDYKSSKKRASTQKATYDRNEMPNPAELDNSVGGLVLLINQPITASIEQERLYEGRLMDAARTGKYTEVIASARARARSLFYSRPSRVLSFDRATMTELLEKSYANAFNHKVNIPISLCYPLNVALLAIVRGCQYDERIVREGISTCMYWTYLDADRVMFYARALRNEEFICGVVYAHAVENVRRAEVDKTLNQYCFLDDFAKEDPKTVREREFGEPINESVLKLRRISTRGGITGEGNFNIDDDADDDDDDGNDSDVQSVFSSSVSVNTNIGSKSTSTKKSSTPVNKTKKKEDGFRETPFRALHGRAHEFSDRLRGTKQYELPVPTITQSEVVGIGYTLQYAPPERLVRRFSLALQCAFRLIDSYYNCILSKWNPCDYFYLFMLAEIQLATQSASGVTTVVTPQTRAAIAAVMEKRVGLLKETSERLAHLVMLVINDSPDAINAATPLFNPMLMLHRVIECFQMDTKLSMRQRRSRAEFEECTVCNGTDALFKFIERHALVDTRMKLEALAREHPTRPVTHTVLRFSTQNVTPLSLLSSMRCYGARDGDDCLIVWTPATMPPLTGSIFVTMTHAIWRRIVAGGVPRALAEARGRGKEMNGRAIGLVAPALVRALRDSDPHIVADALCGIQSLLSHSQRCQPVVWGEQSERATAHIQQTVHALHAAARAIARAAASKTAANGSATDAVRRVRIETAVEIACCVADYGEAVERESLFTVLQTALNAGGAYMFMTRRAAERYMTAFYEQDDILSTPTAFARLLRHQLSLPVMQTTDDVNRYYDTLEEIGKRPVDSCACGMPVECCYRLQQLRDMLYTQRLRPCLEMVIDCCRCSEVRWPKSAGLRPGDIDPSPFMEDHGESLFTPGGPKKKHKPPPRYKVHAGRGTCAACVDRKVVQAVSAPANFVAIYDPYIINDNDDDDDDTNPSNSLAMPAAEIIAELASHDTDVYLRALRVGARPYAVARTVMPHRSWQAKTTSSAAKGDIRGVITSRYTATIVERSRALADARIAKIGAAASTQDNDLIALLTQIEMASFANFDNLHRVVAANEYARVDAYLNVLSEQQMAALAIDGEQLDRNGMVEPGTGKFLFPLTRSAIVESNGIWRPTAASDPQASVVDRSEAMLYAGRMPRPLLGAPQCFMELIFTNWYECALATTSASSSSSSSSSTSSTTSQQQ
jgi:hypothetical protein